MHRAFTQVLLFVIGLVGLVALVPLGVWLGTGRLSAAWRSLKAYGGMLFVLGVCIGFGALLGIIGAAFG